MPLPQLCVWPQRDIPKKNKDNLKNISRKFHNQLYDPSSDDRYLEYLKHRALCNYKRDGSGKYFHYLPYLYLIYHLDSENRYTRLDSSQIAFVLHQELEYRGSSRGSLVIRSPLPHPKRIGKSQKEGRALTGTWEGDLQSACD